MADHKPYRNIYIVGAQSTGKTTLANALSEPLPQEPNILPTTHQQRSCHKRA
jgi:Flp pilus assembly CpaF family ATPase